MPNALLHPGLDVHAQTIVIAIAEATSEVRNYGSISNDLHAVEKVLARIRKARPESEIRVYYVTRLVRPDSSSPVTRPR